MIRRSPKRQVVLTLAAVVLLGMLLVDIVVLRTVQDDLIRSKVSEGYLLAAMLAQMVSTQDPNADDQLPPAARSMAVDITSRNDIIGLAVRGPNRILWQGGRNPVYQAALEKAIKAQAAQKSQRIHLIGRTWAVFWFQREAALLTVPVPAGDRIGLDVGLAVDLKPIYHSLRRDQKGVLIYMGVNLMVLLFIGFMRLSRIYLRPLARLVKQAEAYHDPEALFFAVRREDTELRKLSKALNGMIQRIAADKRQLEKTIASLKSANRELKHAQQEIVRAEKLASVGRLAAGIAHEIGNPIGIVTGYLGLLQGPGLGAVEKKTYLANIDEEIQRIDTIIRQLLDVSRTAPVDLEAVSVHTVIDSMASVMTVQPLLAAIEVQFELAAAKDEVMADAGQLRQVFLNLAINAADAMAGLKEPRKARLMIKTRNRYAESTRGEQIEIMFIDNGSGIAESRVNDIFDPFYTTKAPGKGTGLGLSVSYMIIESFGGGMNATSQTGRGSTFTIRMPLCGNGGFGRDVNPGVD